MPTIRAHVRNGHLVPDQPLDLPEGAAVTVEVTATSTPGQTQHQGTPLDGLEEFIGLFGDLPADASVSYERELRLRIDRR